LRAAAESSILAARTIGNDMRTFALVFALLAALLAVLFLRPFVSAPALAAGTTSVRVFEARNPARGLVDDRHDWIWIWPPAPGTDGRPVLLRRERSSGAVVGRYVPAPEKEAPLAGAPRPWAWCGGRRGWR
jgi:hypothetical protein